VKEYRALNRYDRELVDQISELRKTHTWKQVARIMGYSSDKSVSSVYYQARKHIGDPIPARNVILPADQRITRVAELKAQGMSWPQMARVLGYRSWRSLYECHREAVAKRAKAGVA